MDLLHDHRELYTFALEILDRQPAAHIVVADLLEELGDQGLAQWARSRKSNLRKRLDLVLAMLPCEVTLILGCDFVQHAVEVWHEYPDIRRELQQELFAFGEPYTEHRTEYILAPGWFQALRNWAAGTSELQVDKISELPALFRSRRAEIFHSYGELVEAVLFRQQAITATHEGGRDGHVRNLEQQSRTHIRKAANESRLSIQIIDQVGASTSSQSWREWFGLRAQPQPRRQLPRHTRSDEMKWQINRTRETIERLLQA